MGEGDGRREADRREKITNLSIYLSLFLPLSIYLFIGVL